MRHTCTASAGEGTSTRDIQDMLEQLYGIDVPASTISKITDKVWELVDSWQNRPLVLLYFRVFLG